MDTSRLCPRRTGDGVAACPSPPSTTDWERCARPSWSAPTGRSTAGSQCQLSYQEALPSAPIMTVTADAKKRVFLPHVKPGDRFYMRAKSNSPSPAQRQGQAGVSERSFLSSAERRAEARFRRLAAKGNPARGRQLLAEIQRRLAGAKRIDESADVRRADAGRTQRVRACRGRLF